MNAVILNGSAKGDAAVSAVYDFLLEELPGFGWEVESFVLHDITITPCAGDFGCWVRTPGICLVDDAARTITMKAVQSDLLVLLTRITFGGYSSELKKALDRMISMISPFFTKVNGEVHHEPRYEAYPTLVALGVLPEPDEESEQIFRTLVERNAVNLYNPAHRTEVLFASEGPEKLRERVRAIFSEVEVCA